MVNCLAVIPARIGSTRLAAKPLALINGKPMVVHAYEHALATELFDEVIVATDDEGIRQAIADAGGKAVMTRADHASGTDRVAEVAKKTDAEIIVNVQADLPFVSHGLLAPIVGTLVSEHAIAMATVAVPIRDRARFLDPNVVKVVTDERGFALYFSRAPIPAHRDPDAARADGAFGLQHVGIYGYRRDFLFRFTSWPQSALEKTERLEQLRALERGIKIYVATASETVVEVDTAEDLARANRIAAESETERVGGS
jgi:3-deoxy-manno-octulosonate cytidylyltransferase (CMP-KDO synthetase)